MYVNIDKTCFPEESKFNITIPLKEEALNLSVRHIRSEDTDSENEGMGVTLLDPPEKYIDFVDNLANLKFQKIAENNQV